MPDPAPDYRSRLPALTGLRFFAALCVFFVHAFFLVDPLKPTVPLSFFGDPGVANFLATLFGKSGYLGVTFFFVLSGFVLTWSARPGERVTAFWRRRIVKIFPNHVVMWAAAMVLYASAFTPVGTWLANLLLVHSYFPQPSVFISVNSLSWTLCCELLFYLLFPLIIRPVRRIAEHRLWLWAGVMIAGMVGVELVTVFVIPDHPGSPMLAVSVPQQWFGYIFPPPRLFEFVLGMVLARLVRAGRWPRVGVAPAAALAVIGFFVTNAVPSPFDFTVSAVIPIGVLICATAAADVRGTRTFLRSRVMVWLGNVSFGFYLCQGVVLFYGRLAIVGDGTFSTPVAILLHLGFFGLTLLAGWLLYALVEQPMMRRFARNRRRVPAPTEPVAVDGVASA
ncbi:acyltransferase [Solihabitans fulvus]|uniref:Acyltransferase n=1 Tax=Solihabitans fulvus TaxID=1892852 RepID=A0A5B2XI46_9PSEU|nr:acyltransferase [Solihabitans fulvus]